MNTSGAEYTPWLAVEVEPIYVPYAQAMGVPITHVELPGKIAAASAQALLETCQVLAYMRVLEAQGIVEKRQAAHHTYSAPLTRLVCPSCGDSWDAWVNDDGSLQDERDLYCGNNHKPAAAVELRDGETA